MTGQLALDGVAERPYTARETAFAGFLAGWVYPGAGTFDKLPAGQRDACLQAARAAFEIAEAARPKEATC